MAVAAQIQLLMGQATALVANSTVYTLPPQACLISCDDTSPALEMSNLVDFSTKVAITLDSNKQAQVAHTFVRTTGTTSITVMLKSIV
jgi:hypothetical protein